MAASVKVATRTRPDDGVEVRESCRLRTPHSHPKGSTLWRVCELYSHDAKRTRPDDSLTIKVEVSRSSSKATESWWIDKPREGFSVAAEQEVPRMSESKFAFVLRMNPE